MFLRSSLNASIRYLVSGLSSILHAKLAYPVATDLHFLPGTSSVSRFQKFLSLDPEGYFVRRSFGPFIMFKTELFWW